MVRSRADTHRPDVACTSQPGEHNESSGWGGMQAGAVVAWGGSGGGGRGAGGGPRGQSNPHGHM